jgi:hypothetical protein
MLLSYLPVDAEPPTAEQVGRWNAQLQAIKESGVLVVGAGLHKPDAATTVRVLDEETQIIDGPYAETKEYLAGFFMIEVDNLDDALKWATQLPNSRYGSVEVRPVSGTSVRS